MDDILFNRMFLQYMTLYCVGSREPNLKQVGGAVSIPIFLAMKRRRPPISLGTRLAAASGMGMLGSFLGFAVGGAAASMEVSSNMQDSGR